MIFLTAKLIPNNPYISFVYLPFEMQFSVACFVSDTSEIRSLTSATKKVYL